MGNHKRKRSKSTRAGCLLCKPHKRQGCKHGSPTEQERRARQSEREQLQAIGTGPPWSPLNDY